MIESKQTWMPPKPDKKSTWSFSSRAFSFPRTAFGSASKSKRLPSMQFKRIIPSHVYKSRHATTDQIALQARLRHTLSRQKITRFKKKMSRVFEEKASFVQIKYFDEFFFVGGIGCDPGDIRGTWKSCVCNPIHPLIPTIIVGGNDYRVRL